MAGKSKMDKNERREAIRNLLRQNPCLTDGELADHFSVSQATIRLDRQVLGIPQMRSRMEQLATARSKSAEENVKILSLHVGADGVGAFKTTDAMADRDGYVLPEKLYGASASFAESLAGVPFASTQVGNIKYKIPVKVGTTLVVKGRIALMRQNKKHIYISFFAGDTEVYRAKFIMETLQGM